MTIFSFVAKPREKFKQKLFKQGGGGVIIVVW
jgi:hypothetical protein